MTNQQVIEAIASAHNIITIKRIRVENIECYHTGKIAEFYVELEFTALKEWGTSDYQMKAIISTNGEITRL
tara:strand:- start:253 stop:465 length:213 start_codon:yes stop_codon:yes gene_type:complete